MNALVIAVCIVVCFGIMTIIEPVRFLHDRSIWTLLGMADEDEDL